ncbi:MAG: LysE family translocator [Thermoproteota archaeon]|nr:LysE family translocator [Thermoproteota archaeon]
MVPFKQLPVGKNLTLPSKLSLNTMDIAEFGIEVIAISASGVLAPGPLFFANVFWGSLGNKWSGLKVAYGHTIIELPLIIMLAEGLFTLDAPRKYLSIISLVGGIGLLGFASFQIVNNLRKGRENILKPFTNTKGPFILGLSLTALNPFFMLWWFTAGLKLIADSAQFGAITGAMILFSFHIWMDYAWLALTAYLASRGARLLKSRYYRILLFLLSLLLIYYGITYLLQAVSQQAHGQEKM